MTLPQIDAESRRVTPILCAILPSPYKLRHVKAVRSLPEKIYGRATLVDGEDSGKVLDIEISSRGLSRNTEKAKAQILSRVAHEVAHAFLYPAERAVLNQEEDDYNKWLEELVEQACVAVQSVAFYMQSNEI